MPINKARLKVKKRFLGIKGARFRAAGAEIVYISSVTEIGFTDKHAFMPLGLCLNWCFCSSNNKYFPRPQNDIAVPLAFCKWRPPGTFSLERLFWGRANKPILQIAKWQDPQTHALFGLRAASWGQSYSEEPSVLILSPALTIKHQRVASTWYKWCRSLWLFSLYLARVTLCSWSCYSLGSEAHCFWFSLVASGWGLCAVGQPSRVASTLPFASPRLNRLE